MFLKILFFSLEAMPLKDSFSTSSLKLTYFLTEISILASPLDYNYHILVPSLF